MAQDEKHNVKSDDSISNAQSDSSSEGSESRGAGGLLGKAFERIITVGMTGAFVAEESLRTYLNELKLPKDVISNVLQGALKSKEEIAGKITREVLQMLSKVDLTKEAAKFLESHKMRVSAEIEFFKKDTEAEKKP